MTSIIRSSDSEKLDFRAESVTLDESNPVLVYRSVPNSSSASLNSSELYLLVPSVSIDIVKLARPGLSFASDACPEPSNKLKLTIGTSFLSANTISIPLLNFAL